MRTGAEVKVGLITLAAIVLLVVFAYFIGGGISAARTYPVYVLFDDARGLSKGDPVRMVGVKIGEVKSVTITPPPRKAQVELSIEERYPVYKNYVFQISSAGLFQERSIEVLPALPGKEGPQLSANAKVPGVEGPNLAEMLKSGQQLLTSLNQTSEQLRSVLGNEQFLQGVQRALTSFAEAADSAADMAATAASIARKAEPASEAILNQLLEAANDLQSTSSKVRATLTEGTTLQDMQAAAAHVSEMTQNLDEITATVDRLVSSPETKAEVRETLANVRDAAASLKKVGSDLEAFSGELKTAAPTVPKVVRDAEKLTTTVTQLQERLKPPEIHAGFQVLYSAKAGRSFSTGNVDFSYAATPGHFIRLGLDDIGEESDLNVQLGERGRLGALRYGLVRSRLGVGLDLSLRRRSTLSLDVFNPNSLRADAIFSFPLGRSDWALLAGARDIGKENLFVIGGKVNR